mmetsp:Transcript_46298/g.91144  ORF Transcript_46298/g.91144 Transcript_46298/m.91144 type:complete len:328 (+) Transcript_46298:428-1411(+)
MVILSLAPMPTRERSSLFCPDIKFSFLCISLKSRVSCSLWKWIFSSLSLYALASLRYWSTSAIGVCILGSLACLFSKRAIMSITLASSRNWEICRSLSATRFSSFLISSMLVLVSDFLRRLFSTVTVWTSFIRFVISLFSTFSLSFQAAKLMSALPPAIGGVSLLFFLRFCMLANLVGEREFLSFSYCPSTSFSCSRSCWLTFCSLALASFSSSFKPLPLAESLLCSHSLIVSRATLNLCCTDRNLRVSASSLVPSLTGTVFSANFSCWSGIISRNAGSSSRAFSILRREVRSAVSPFNFSVRLSLLIAACASCRRRSLISPFFVRF